MDPHLTDASLDPPESTSQSASRSVLPFFARLTAESPYTLQWVAPFHIKITAGYGPHPKHKGWALFPNFKHSTTETNSDYCGSSFFAYKYDNAKCMDFIVRSRSDAQLNTRFMYIFLFFSSTKIVGSYSSLNSGIIFQAEKFDSQPRSNS